MNNKLILGIVVMILCVTIGIVYYTYTNKENSIQFSLGEQTQITKDSKTISDPQSVSKVDVAESSKLQSEFVEDVTNESTEKLTEESQDESLEGFTEDSITVYLYGAIKNSGIYQISVGARVYQVIELAGGLNDNVDPGYVNQARVLVDGESIFFPTVKEAKELPRELPRENGSNDVNNVVANNQSSLININLASKEELMSLPGIGESRALDIIAYRETKGLFTSKEDIMNVTGIKNAIFTKIEKLIVVN